MRHPFELEISDLEAVNFNIEELTNKEATQAFGGGAKPPIYTTLALGEEGGCFPTRVRGEAGGVPS